VVGIGFPPIPIGLASPLARLWPGGSHTPLLICERTAAPPVRGGAGDEQTFYGEM
jgi:hypothetical protein